jgi:hypothetical protein
MTNIISTTYNTNWIEHNRLIYEQILHLSSNSGRLQGLREVDDMDM